MRTELFVKAPDSKSWLQWVPGLKFYLEDVPVYFSDHSITWLIDKSYEVTGFRIKLETANAHRAVNILNLASFPGLKVEINEIKESDDQDFVRTRRDKLFPAGDTSGAPVESTDRKPPSIDLLGGKVKVGRVPPKGVPADPRWDKKAVREPTARRDNDGDPED